MEGDFTKAQENRIEIKEGMREKKGVMKEIQPHFSSKVVWFKDDWLWKKKMQ